MRHLVKSPMGRTGYFALLRGYKPTHVVDTLDVASPSESAPADFHGEINVLEQRIEFKGCNREMSHSHLLFSFMFFALFVSVTV
jgi:hypothetical protein